MHEVFEHTADLGLRIRAADLEALFAEAATALFSVIVVDLGSVRPEKQVEIRLAADAPDMLLVDWLRELLFHFDGEHLLMSRFTVQLGGGGLHGTAWGEPLDRTRHQLEHEVKAITYHGLRLEQTSDGWLAEVIVDI